MYMNRMKMLLWTALVLCFFSSIYAEQLHEHMTNDEIRSIFNVHEDDVDKLDYELVEILHINTNNDDQPERKLHTAQPKLHINTFNQNYTLYLEENDNLLLGDETPIFLSENRSPNYDEPNIVYSKIKYPSLGNFKLYHDVEKKVAISLEHENDDRFHVNGVIGDDIVIRSLPKRIHDEVLSQASSRSRRSSSSNDNDSRFGDAFKKTSHVFIKSNVTLPYFGSLNTINRNDDSSISTSSSVIDDIQPVSQKPLSSAMSEPEIPYILSDEEITRSKSRVPPVKDIVYPQLLITIDYETYKVHGTNVVETAKYIAAFWNAVDLRFRVMGRPFVRLNIAGLIIPKQPSAAMYLEKQKFASGVIFSDKTLTHMGKYFSTHTTEFPLNTYDLIVAITHKKLAVNVPNGEVDIDITGTSKFQGACRVQEGSAVAILKDLGGFSGITTAAHELAHLFGAPHDGPNTQQIPGGPCAWENGYLMSYARKDERGMHFSICSVRTMQNFLQVPQAECLRNKPSVGKSYSKIFPGKLMSRDEQCRRTMGKDWVSYKEKENSCAILWCISDVEGIAQMNYRPPAEGSYCADKSICLNSACVLDPELI